VVAAGAEVAAEGGRADRAAVGVVPVPAASPWSWSRSPCSHCCAAAR